MRSRALSTFIRPVCKCQAGGLTLRLEGGVGPVSLHSCGDDIRHSESLQGHAHVAAAALTHEPNQEYTFSHTQKCLDVSQDPSC